MTATKITCAIMCHNYGRYLRQAIDSCLKQKRNGYELEVVVIDDGSTDDTPLICRDYGDQIRTLRSDEAQGAARSLDRAIEFSTGEFVFLLDADDFFAEQKIVAALPAILDGALYIEHPQFNTNESGEVTYFNLKGGNTSTIGVNRLAALTLMPIQNEIFLHPLCSAGKGIRLTEPLSYFRQHALSRRRTRTPLETAIYRTNLARDLETILERLENEGVFWADTSMLKAIRHEYASIRCYYTLKALLIEGRFLPALHACYAMIQNAALSRTGIVRWHMSTVLRAMITVVHRMFFRHSKFRDFFQLPALRLLPSRKKTRDYA